MPGVLVSGQYPNDVINYTEHDLADEVRRIASGRGVNVVYDSGGWRAGVRRARSSSQ
ncbi:MAG TPA: hypothetical protein VK929_03945 [Longimicrobiales bacterium]|nr:hypothetical protein [Longimicrobiales bacterium]